MGWGYGIDQNGREAGYTVQAECDHPECSIQIDRGLSYRCGGPHFDNDACSKYFCEQHRSSELVVNHDGEREWVDLCAACTKDLAVTDDDEESEDVA